MEIYGYFIGRARRRTSAGAQAPAAATAVWRKTHMAERRGTTANRLRRHRLETIEQRRATGGADGIEHR